jgi:hypothetical protein
MNKLLLTLCTLGTLLLSACASKPPPPDWQNNAFAALNSFTSAYLNGNTKVAEFEFARAKTEVARTGRADLMARLELTRCAVQVASLDLQPCTGYDALGVWATERSAQVKEEPAGVGRRAGDTEQSTLPPRLLTLDAQPAERAYAAFINGRWSGLDPALLPVAYRSLVTQALEVEKSGVMPKTASATTPQDAQAISALSQIQDPLSRLIAAGVLLQRKQLTPIDVGLAVNTASDQGWRRPLLAWLGVQFKQQQTAGNAAAASETQRRIDLVLQTPAK